VHGLFVLKTTCADEGEGEGEGEGEEEGESVVRVRGGMGMGREARGKERTPTRKREREREEGCGHALKPPSGDVAENMQLVNQRQDQMHSCDAQAK
jgi:hypothetical protein